MYLKKEKKHLTASVNQSQTSKPSTISFCLSTYTMCKAGEINRWIEADGSMQVPAPFMADFLVHAGVFVLGEGWRATSRLGTLYVRRSD